MFSVSLFSVSAWMLMFLNCNFEVIKLWSNGGDAGAPWWSYWSAGITNTIGPAMGIEALKYISYPAQACFKSCTFSIFVNFCAFG